MSKLRQLNRWLLLLGLLTIACTVETPTKPVVSATAAPRQAAAATLPPVVVCEYQGKYQENQRFLRLQQRIPALVERTLSLVAQRMGLAYHDRGQITVKFNDWNTSTSVSASLHPVIESGQKHWQINLVSEYFVSGQELLDFSIPQLLTLAIIREKMAPQAQPLPEWLIQGAVHYVVDQQHYLSQRFIARQCENNVPFSSLLSGLANKNCRFPEVEGYLALLFLQQSYHQGAAKLKRYFDQVFWHGKDWEKELQRHFGLLFFEFHQKSLHFSRAHLGSRYRGGWIAYRQALGYYLRQEYLRAIPRCKKLLLQYPDNFFAPNLEFWLGMCYYRLKKYRAAQRYFQQAGGKLPHYCNNLALARYRSAMCSYHQEMLAGAIIQLDNFIRDFPYHPFVAGAHYFIAASFAGQAQWQRAFYWYDRYFAKFPKHHRRAEALMAAAQAAERLGWIGQAKNYYRRFAGYCCNYRQSAKKKGARDNCHARLCRKKGAGT